jgi:hypothetical protein
VRQNIAVYLTSGAGCACLCMSRARCAHGSRTTHHRTERVRVDNQQTTCKNIDWRLITRTTHNTNYNIYKYRRPKSCTKLRNSHIVRTSVHVAGTSSASRAPKNRCVPKVGLGAENFVRRALVCVVRAGRARRITKTLRTGEREDIRTSGREGHE